MVIHSHFSEETKAPKHHGRFVEVYAHLSDQGFTLRFGICNLDFND